MVSAYSLEHSEPLLVLLWLPDELSQGVKQAKNLFCVKEIKSAFCNNALRCHSWASSGETEKTEHSCKKTDLLNGN